MSIIGLMAQHIRILFIGFFDHKALRSPYLYFALIQTIWAVSRAIADVSVVESSISKSHDYWRLAWGIYFYVRISDKLAIVNRFWAIF